jgi:hypothetical protein
MLPGDTSLKAISIRVKEYMETTRCATNTEITNAVVTGLQSTGDTLPVQTLHRRIYDVITVLTVVGHLKKTEKGNLWTGERRPQGSRHVPELQAKATRIESKEEALRYKARILMLYRALVCANRAVPRPPRALSFPLIIIGQKGSEWVVRTDRDKREIWIEAASKPKLYSPFEILACKSFPASVMQNAITSLPELKSCRDLLKPPEAGA